jgi:hypothetical protein
MRDWLRRRDEDRRQQGITVPDTVEQLEPAGNVTVPRRRQWPESAGPGFDLGRSAASGDADGVTDGEKDGEALAETDTLVTTDAEDVDDTD